tara:strand:+ start:5812 stop:6216 length:405 start_codon:yes stop_codon:yes gene_type:complete
MGASLYNFEIEQGSSFKMSLIYKDSAGAVIDLTGWCARLTWRTSANLTQTYKSGNTDKTSYDFNIEGPTGKINLLFPANTTNGFDFNTAKYDLELQSDEDHYSQGGKFVIRLLYGTVTIQRRYSKSNQALECNT